MSENFTGRGAVQILIHWKHHVLLELNQRAVYRVPTTSLLHNLTERTSQNPTKNVKELHGMIERTIP